MIYNYDSAFEQQLKDRLTEMLERKRFEMEAGYPADFPAYRKVVGYLEALKDFSAVLDQIHDSMNKPEEN